MDSYLPNGYRWAEPRDNEAIDAGTVKAVRVPVENLGHNYSHAERLLKRLAVSKD